MTTPMASYYHESVKLSLMQVMAQPVVVYSFFFSFIVLCVYFFTCGRMVKTEKQISWLLTLASSVLCTFVSAPYCHQFFRSGRDIQWLSIDSALHTALACFFISYLILDLGFGLMYYSRRITLVTGWIHHTVYIVVLFWLMRCRASSFFTINAILELPTVLLAIGAIHPPWRCDWLFAMLFFLLRIVYHIAIIYQLKCHPHRLAHLWLVALLILPLHLYWFHAIARGLLRKYTSSSTTLAYQTQSLRPPYIDSKTCYS